MVGAGSAMVGCGVRLIGSARASAGDILGVIIDLMCCASVYAQLFLDLRCKSKNDVGGEGGDFPTFPVAPGLRAPRPRIFLTHIIVHLYTHPSLPFPP